jgi:diguanylate cyclase (GGDEF)-like protein
MWKRRYESGDVLSDYVCALATLSAAMMVLCWLRFGVDLPTGRLIRLGLLCLVLVACEMRPIRVVRDDGVDDVVASTTFAFAILLTFGPVIAMLAQGVASVLADANLHKRRIKVVFNVAQYWLSWGAATFVFVALAGGPGAFTDVTLSPRWYGAAAAAGLTYFLANNVLVGTAMALFGKQPMLRTLQGTIQSEWGSDFVLLALTPVVVMVTADSVAALPLLLLPILAVYRSASLSVEKEHLALHDSLTDLPNRFQFSSMLKAAIGDATRRPGKGAILLIDLDRFKEVNDTLGHQAGDELLRLVGPRISQIIPDGGAVARLGGDEFAVLLPDLPDEPEATAIAYRIADALDTPFRIEGFNVEVGASIGLAIYPSDGATDEVLMKRADIAMYLAKAQRTVVERYDPRLDHHTTRRLELVSELRLALGDGAVQLYFQPKLDLQTNEVAEVEALVRWMHPRLGIIAPSEFVPLAEHTGLIRPLTSHVLRVAAAQAARWRQEGRPLVVAVNLSARSLHDGAILQEVGTVLRETGLPPSLLRLEITESSIMAQPARARRVLEELSDMGVRLSIDDFGTGYSSLAYLNELPVSEVKIDRSFITNVLDREGDQVIVRSIIDLGRNLGLTSVAEGVETEAALQWLRAVGCDQAQGYHIARPMTVGALDEWLDGRHHRTLAKIGRTNVVPLIHVNQQAADQPDADVAASFAPSSPARRSSN